MPQSQWPNNRVPLVNTRISLLPAIFGREKLLVDRQVA